MRRRWWWFFGTWLMALAVVACIVDVAVDLLLERSEGAPSQTRDLLTAAGVIIATVALSAWVFWITWVTTRLYRGGATVILDNPADYLSDDSASNSGRHSLFSDHHDSHGEYQ